MVDDRASGCPTDWRARRCGARRLDDLPRALAGAGVPLCELVVYDTVDAAGGGDAAAAALAAAAGSGGSGAWAVFFSPSGVRAALSSAAARGALQGAGGARVGAIGATTAAALRDAGCGVAAVAAKPTPEELFTALEAAEVRAPEGGTS